VTLSSSTAALAAPASGDGGDRQRDGDVRGYHRIGLELADGDHHGSLNGSSLTAAITLSPAAALRSLTCTPANLGPLASSTCAVPCRPNGRAGPTR